MNALALERELHTALAQACIDVGIVYANVPADGAWHRTDVTDDRAGKGDGSIKLFSDSTGGIVCNWKGETRPFFVDAGRKLSAAEQVERKRTAETARAEAEAERQKRSSHAATLALSVWTKAKPVDADHPYLARKGVKPTACLREIDAGRLEKLIGYRPKSSGEPLVGRVLIAPIKVDDKLTSLEMIDAVGRKSALRNGIKASGYWAAEKLPDAGFAGDLLVCEGVATTLSAYSAVLTPAVAALSCGNLRQVAVAMRALYPEASIVVCTDLGNGEKDAHAAAQAVSGRVTRPVFAEGAEIAGTVPSDFNDMHLLAGADAVRTAIQGAAFHDNLANDGTALVPHAPKGFGVLGPRFDVSRSGVYYVGVKHDSKAEADIELPPLWLCDRLEIIGRGEDETGRGYRILQWNSRGSGTERITAFPLAMIGEREGWVTLRERGLAIATSRPALERLSEYLQVKGSDTLYRVTECGGWTNGAYILPNGEVLGEPSTPLFYHGDKSGGSAYRAKGTLEGWRSTVAHLAHGNTRPMLTIGTALAAPLLHLVELESGGFHLFGTSSSGKTTLAEVSASLWGAPREQILNWDSTALALANAAAARNDGMMLLDEIGQGDPDAVSKAAYRLFNGTGKMQGAKDGGNREQARWRVLVLSTGEVDLAGFMSGGGHRTRAGQEVRLASLPADAGKGFGTFDQLNGQADAGQLAEALKEAVRLNHGVAGRAFIEHVAGNLDSVAARLRHAIKDVYADLPSGVSGQIRRVAARFAVTAEALEIATDIGLTGWQQGDGSIAIKKCFEGWLSRYGLGNREEVQIIEQAEAWFGANASARFIDCFKASNPHGDRHITNCAGYRKRDDAGEPFWLIYPAAFSEEIAGGFDKTIAADVLAKAGMLKKGSDGKATSKHKTPDMPKVARRFYKIVRTVRECDDE